jgi:transporter family-2 protein
MDRLGYVVLPLVGGALIALQAPINARLRLVLASPAGSALVSFLVGVVVLTGFALVRAEAGSLARLGGGPWWAYLGGICGAVFVVATLLAAPRVGVTTTFVAVISGQLVAAALIDRFGWLGAKQIALSNERLAAIGLMAVALVLLARGS